MGMVAVAFLAVCVETSAREAFVRDYYVVVVSDGTAAYVQHDHDMTLKNIGRFFARLPQWMS
jgi:ureidoacrylate peracid hydrolase